MRNQRTRFSGHQFFYFTVYKYITFTSIAYRIYYVYLLCDISRHRVKWGLCRYRLNSFVRPQEITNYLDRGCPLVA